MRTRWPILYPMTRTDVKRGNGQWAGLSWLRWFGPAGFALVVGLCLSAGAGWLARQEVLATDRQRFVRLSEKVMTLISDRLRNCERLMAGAQGLFAAREFVERAEWRAYVNSFDLKRDFPGASGLGYAALVPRTDLAAFLHRTRNDGIPLFGVRTVGDAENLIVSKLIEPEGQHGQDLGRDLYPEPKLRDAFERSMRTGKPTLTVALLPEREESEQLPLLFVAPVYRHGQPHGTEADRLSTIEGWIYVPLLIHEMMDGIAEAADDLIFFEVFDGTEPSRATLLFDADGHGLASSVSQAADASHVGRDFQAEAQLSHGGHEWTVRISARPEFDTASESHGPSLVLLGGVVASVLLSLFIWSQSTGNNRARALAGKMTQGLRKKEEELRAKQAELQAVHDASPLGLFVTDPHGATTYTNAMCQWICGWAENESRYKDWSSTLHPEDRERILREWKEATTRGQLYETTLRCQHASGKIIWASLKAAPIHDGSAIKGYVGTMEDVSERKHNEEERDRMELQLRQAQKLESIGQLAAGIAHEINTPTQYIGDNLRFLRDGFTDLLDVLASHQRLLSAVRQRQITDAMTADAETLLEKADLSYLAQEIPNALRQSVEGVERVCKIVGAMKEFSHPGTEDKVKLNINHAIESTLTVCRHEWKYVAELVTDFDPGLPPVLCLPGEFNQVILNIVVNAAHAIGDVVGGGGQKKGVITVNTKQDGEWAEIRITDSGGGIPEKARGKIFDPFFTTKGVGKGTGQGLAIAHSVVTDKHGGTITFETEIGVGTTFIIRLPIASTQTVKVEEAA